METKYLTARGVGDAAPYNKDVPFQDVGDGLLDVPAAHASEFAEPDAKTEPPAARATDVRPDVLYP